LNLSERRYVPLIIDPSAIRHVTDRNTAPLGLIPTVSLAGNILGSPLCRNE